MEIIKADNVVKTYDVSKKTHIEALKGLNLSVQKGTIVTIYGVSGSGKSTLLRTDEGPEPHQEPRNCSTYRSRKDNIL